MKRLWKSPICLRVSNSIIIKKMQIPFFSFRPQTRKTAVAESSTRNPLSSTLTPGVGVGGWGVGMGVWGWGVGVLGVGWRGGEGGWGVGGEVGWGWGVGVGGWGGGGVGVGVGWPSACVVLNGVHRLLKAFCDALKWVIMQTFISWWHFALGRSQAKFLNNADVFWRQFSQLPMCCNHKLESLYTLKSLHLLPHYLCLIAITDPKHVLSWTVLTARLLTACLWSPPDGHAVAIYLWKVMMIYHMRALCVSSGERCKNAYERLNLIAPKCYTAIVQRMGKVFHVEIERPHLKFYTNYLTHTLKNVTLCGDCLCNTGTFSPVMYFYARI